MVTTGENKMEVKDLIIGKTYRIKMGATHQCEVYTGVITDFGIEHLFINVVLNYNQVSKWVSEIKPTERIK